jgi:hypothetical protein
VSGNSRRSVFAPGLLFDLLFLVKPMVEQAPILFTLHSSHLVIIRVHVVGVLHIFKSYLANSTCKMTSLR